MPIPTRIVGWSSCHRSRPNVAGGSGQINQEEEPMTPSQTRIERDRSNPNRPGLRRARKAAFRAITHAGKWDGFPAWRQRPGTSHSASAAECSVKAATRGRYRIEDAAESDGYTDWQEWLASVL